MRDRSRIISALTTMPDEAFGWLVRVLCTHHPHDGMGASAWPDGIDGFEKASQDAIKATQNAADLWYVERGD